MMKMEQLTKDIEQNLSALIANAKIGVCVVGEKVFLSIKISDLLSEIIFLPLTDKQIKHLVTEGRVLSETRTTRFELILEELDG